MRNIETRGNKLMPYPVSILFVALLTVCISQLLPFQIQNVSAQQSSTSIATSTASSTAPKTLQFLGNQNIAPIVFTEDGMPAGVVVDITSALTPYLREPIEIRAMDWLTAQLMVAEGQADALIQINPTDERKKTYDFSDPLLESQFSIFSRADRVDIKGVTSLHGMKVGIEQSGLPQQTLADHPEIQLIIIPNFLEGFKQVNDGVLDAVVADYRVGSYILAINNIQNVAPAGEPVAFSYSAFAVKKGNTQLLNEINSALRTIKKNGMYQAILTKWKPTETVIQTQEQITQELFYTIIIILAALFVIAVVWSLTVNRELGRRKKAEKYAEKLVSGANAMVVSLDVAGKVTVFNDAAAKITGYTPAEAIGKNWFELVTPRKRFPEVWKIFEDFQKQGKPIVGEFKNPILTKSGEERMIEWRNSDLRDNGNVVGTISYGIDITEQEKAVAALRAERGLFIAGPTIVFRWKNEEGWPVEYVSANITEQFGYSVESLTSGKVSFAGIVHPDDVARVGAEVEKYEKEGVKAFKQTYRIKHTNGNYRWIDDFTTVLRNNKGEVTHFLGYVMDITEREKAEKANKLIGAIVESSDDAIYSKTPDNIITTWNSGAEKIYGFTADEIIGKSIKLIVPENKREELEGLISQIMKGERVHHFETVRTTKGGQEIQVSVSLSPVLDEKGNLTAISAISRDITERKHAEEILRESTARLNEAQRLAHVGSWELNIVNNVLTWSDEIFRIFEIDQKQFGATYEAFLNAIHPEDRNVVDAAYANSLKTKKPYSIDHRLLIKDGRVKYVSEQCETYYDDNGKALRSVGSVQDITERKTAEMELVRLNRELRMVSHVNKALIHITDEASFLKEACRVAVEIGNYRLAWVGFAENDEAKTIRTIAQAGFEEGYLEHANFTWADNERGRGPGAVAIRTGKAQISRDISTDPKVSPYREDALKRGYRSVIALPLKQNGNVFGIYAIYSNEPDAFAEAEVEILDELASDIAFGIVTLRARIEEKLAEERFEAIFNNVNDGVLLVNNETMKFDIANETMTRMLGYTRAELAKLSIENIHPKEQLAHVMSEFKKQMKGEIKVARDLPVARKDGSIFYADVNTSTITLRGKQYALGVFRDITESKQMLEELQKLRKAADTSGEAIYMTDKQGIFTYVNSSFTQLYGFSANEVIGKVTPRILKSGLRPADVYVKFWKDLLAAKVIRDKHINKTKDGKLLTIDNSVNPILDEHGNIIGFLAIQRDITEREKIDKVIRENEAEMKEAQRVGNFGSFDWDSRTDVIKWSDEYYRIYGFSPETKPPGYEEHLKTYTPESAAKLDAAVKRSMETGEPYEVDLEQANPIKGAARWITARGEVKRDENNKIVGLRGTAQDITERKLAQETITSERTTLQGVLDNAPLGIWLMEPNGKMRFVNRTFCDAVGITEKQFIEARHYSDVLNPQTALSCMRSDKQALAQDKPHTSQEILRFVDGKPHLLEITKVKLRDTVGATIGLIGISLDITERKQSEERIKELGELRSKFLNIMAHQLRTPLSSVNWNLEMLISGDLGKMEDTQKKFLQVTYGESKKITNRIRDLLAAVDIEDKRTLVKTEEVAIDSMAATIIAEARDHALSKGVTFNYEGPHEALPPIMGDAEKLRIALSQLVENAVTYTKEKGTVSASLAMKGDIIRFEVKDTGIGIPESEQKRIHERFYRASNASIMHPDGFGLGLYVTRYFVEQHGGTLGFTSKEGEGSTFWFEIPTKN